MVAFYMLDISTYICRKHFRPINWTFLAIGRNMNNKYLKQTTIYNYFSKSLRKKIEQFSMPDNCFVRYTSIAISQTKGQICVKHCMITSEME